MTTGYDSERDLFVTRACLDMLIKSPDTTKAKAVMDYFRDTIADSPLLNFLELFIECIEMGEADMIKLLVSGEAYEAELKRDPSIYEKINTIYEKKFKGSSLKQVNPMQAMLGNLMGGGGMGSLFPGM